MEKKRSLGKYAHWGSWLVLTACAGAVSVGLERFVLFLTKAYCSKTIMDCVSVITVIILAFIFNLIRALVAGRGKSAGYGIEIAVIVPLLALWLFAALYLFRDDCINFLDASAQGIVPVINSYYHVHILYKAESGIGYISQTIGALVLLTPICAAITWEIIIKLKPAISLALFGILFAASLMIGLVPGILPVAFMLVGAIAVIPASQGRAKGAYEAAILGGIAVVAAVIAHSAGTPMVNEAMKTTEDTKVKVASFWNDGDRWNINKLMPSLASGGINGGELGKIKGFSYTDKTHIELKTDIKPEGPVYMRAFIGGDYTGDSWTTADESREHMADRITHDAYEQIYRYRRDVTGESNLDVSRVRASDQYVYRPYALSQATYPDASASQYSYTFYQSKWPLGVYYTGALSDTSMASEEKNYRNYAYNTFTNVPAGLDTLKEECRRANTGSFELAYKYIMTRLQECTYNMDVGVTPQDADFINYFLYDKHEGYCAHFASTATVMFRMAGYPARYVTGYVVDRDAFSETGYNEYTADVKDRAAHAWTEVYLDGTGWVVVDATPGHARSNDATVYSITSSKAVSSNMSSGKTEQAADANNSNTGSAGASGENIQDSSDDMDSGSAGTGSGQKNSGSKASGSNADGDGQSIGGIVIPASVMKVIKTILAVIAVCIAVIAAVTVIMALIYCVMRTIVWRGLRLPASGDYNRIVEKKFHWMYNIALAAGLPDNINSAGAKFINMFTEHFEDIDRLSYKNIINIVRRANYSDDEISREEADKVVSCCRLMLAHEERRLTPLKRWKLYFNILAGRGRQIEKS